MHTNIEQINLKKNLIITITDDEGILIDRETLKSFWLNETACHLFTLFKENNGCTKSSVLSSLHSKYAYERPEKISEDIDSFMEELMSFDLLTSQKSVV